MNKGQIFSLDFLLATIIMIIFIGTTINAFETRTYLIKEEINSDILIQNSNSAFIALTNGIYSCKTENYISLPFTINETVLNSKNIGELKASIGLQDKNISLEINGTKVFDEINQKETIIAIENEVLFCNNIIELKDLEDCLNGNCIFEKKKIILMVEK